VRAHTSNDSPRAAIDPPVDVGLALAARALLFARLRRCVLCEKCLKYTASAIWPARAREPFSFLSAVTRTLPTLPAWFMCVASQCGSCVHGCGRAVECVCASQQVFGLGSLTYLPRRVLTAGPLGQRPGHWRRTRAAFLAPCSEETLVKVSLGCRGTSRRPLVPSCGWSGRVY
jgi:hypothetical protein